MKKPALVIMAAGMGSRYGGLKQIDPVDEYGNIIIDFSVYDALRTGFEEIVFIIKHEIEEDFKSAIGRRIEKLADVKYVYQQLDALPDGFTVPEGRVKPWGTTHAILCCKELLGERSFVPLNADDYYGPEAFRLAFNFLMNNHKSDEHCVIGYPVINTLTENGSVSRGVCVVGENDMLKDIRERTNVSIVNGRAAFTEDEGKTYTMIPESSTVSMNMWGFNSGLMNEIEKSFPAFLEKNIPLNPLKCEDYLPEAVRRAVENQRASVRVLATTDRWHGVTYAEDKPELVQAIRRLKDNGTYPEKLWD